MSMKKELTMKAVAEIFKLASRINIKPKDIIGMGGDIVKMGKSLFNTKVNPKLTEFINKKGEIPTKIVEDLKIHLRSLKNASENQVELFKLNLKDIVNAKFPPKVDVIKLPVSSSKKLATSGTELGGFSYKNNLLKEIDKKIMTEMEMSSKELYAMSDDALMSLRRNADPIRMEEYFSLEAEVFKGWTPTVIKGGKDPKFNEGGVAKLNAELNQLPEYYLPMEKGGIANHFRKKFDQGSDETGVKLSPILSMVNTSETPVEGIDVDVSDIDYGIAGMFQGDTAYAGGEYTKGKVKVNVQQDGNTVFEDSMSKDDLMQLYVGLGEKSGNHVEVGTDGQGNYTLNIIKSFADGGIATHFRAR